MNSLGLTIDLVLSGLFTVLLIVLSISEARHGKKVEREKVREPTIIKFKITA